MEHVYLTKEDIEKAAKSKQITKREKDELFKRIDYDSRSRRRSKIRKS